jgi:hypothetical protein
MNHDRGSSNKRFDPATVDVLKLSSEIDCEIVIDECTFALTDIDSQLATPNFGDQDWKEACIKAKRTIEHKRGLVQKKLSAMIGTRASARHG